MLTVNQVRQYSANIQAEISEINSHKVVVAKDELMKFMQKHSKEQNTLMIAMVPSHGMAGDQDSAQWVNMTGFYFLEKTTYSEHDHDSYIDIFERTQNVAKKFVQKLLADKSDNTGLFCNFLAFLDEHSIRVDPIVSMNDCNGWLVQISFRSNM